MNSIQFDPEINQFLADFYLMTGMRVGIHDPQNTILTEYPKTSSEYDEMGFCDKARAYSQKFDERCIACDREAVERVSSTHRTYVYRCHMGFWEAMIPIMDGDEMICALFIGQVRNADERSDFAPTELTSFLTSVGIPESVAVQQYTAYCEMLREPEKRFKATVHVLEMCVQKIYDNHLIRRNDRDLMKLFQTYVERHLLEPITVGSTAKALGISASYLSRQIRVNLNTNFTDYLLEKRMSVARDRLSYTDRSISEIANELCYTDAGYFMSVFKRVNGMTCLEYRKKARK